MFIDAVPSSLMLGAALSLSCLKRAVGSQSLEACSLGLVGCFRPPLYYCGFVPKQGLQGYMRHEDGVVEV